MTPTQAGFLDFLRGTVMIGVNALPDAAPAIGWAFIYAVQMAPMVSAAPLIGANIIIGGGLYDPYSMMVYNLGTDFLINTAPDVAGSSFFAGARKQFGLDKFTPGVVSSSSDSGTSVSLDVPDFFKNISLNDLQALKTPWGRTYVMLAQQYSNNWGLS